MNPQTAQQQYLRTRVMTATPEQLQMMLYDGAIRFSEQARAALEARDYEKSYNMISRVQKIITEMSCTLKREVLPELCDKLTALYGYVYKKLIEANVQHSVGAIDEALELLRYQRETWALLLDQLGRQKAAVAATKINLPAPDPRMEAGISMQG
jgi:flagellar secretion chaperone FliS